jgi:hypothetical protein
MSILRTRGGLFLLLLLANMAATLLAVWTLDVTTLGIDDAYIYFVYAKNFLASGEFVYNLGGERVEGFSSPLWMLICIAAMWVSPEPQIPLFLFASVLATTITYLAIRYTEDLLGQNNEAASAGGLHAGSWLYLAMLLGNPSWLAWNIASLMETPLWGALIFFAMMRLIFILRAGCLPSSDRWLTPLLLALLVLCRPEAPLWVCWFLLAYTLVLRALGFDAGRLTKALVPAVLAIAVAGGLLFGIRMSYFGYLFANTYYAKMSPDFFYNLGQGALYLLEFCVENGIAVVGIIVAAWLAFRNLYLVLPISSRRDPQTLRADTEQFVLAGTVAAGVAAALITGGDKFGGFRFYQSFLPVLYLLIVYAGIHLTPWLRSRLVRPISNLNGLAVAALALLIFSDVVKAGWDKFYRTNLAIEFNIAKHMRATATLLDEIFLSSEAPLPRIAVIPAGGFKFDSQAPVFDMMGLNLTSMAHSDVVRDGIKNHAAFDPDVFWELDINILGARLCAYESKPWKDFRFESRVLKGLPQTERFADSYSYSHLRLKGETSWVCGYFSNSLISEIQANPALEIHNFDDHEQGSHPTCDTQEACMNRI